MTTRSPGAQLLYELGLLPPDPDDPALHPAICMPGRLYAYLHTLRGAVAFAPDVVVQP